MAVSEVVVQPTMCERCPPFVASKLLKISVVPSTNLPTGMEDFGRGATRCIFCDGNVRQLFRTLADEDRNAVPAITSGGSNGGGGGG